MTQPLRELLPLVENLVSVLLTQDYKSAELTTLRELAEQVRAQMQDVPGVVDLAVEEQSNLPFATVRFDREALARHGLTVRDVAETIETAFYGRVVSRVLTGSYAFDLSVRYPDDAREDLDRVREAGGRSDENGERRENQPRHVFTTFPDAASTTTQRLGADGDS